MVNREVSVSNNSRGNFEAIRKMWMPDKLIGSKIKRTCKMSKQFIHTTFGSLPFRYEGALTSLKLFPLGQKSVSFLRTALLVFGWSRLVSRVGRWGEGEVGGLLRKLSGYGEMLRNGVVFLKCVCLEEAYLEQLGRDRKRLVRLKTIRAIQINLNRIIKFPSLFAVSTRIANFKGDSQKVSSSSQNKTK